jgi:hypothetical protein
MNICKNKCIKDKRHRNRFVRICCCKDNGKVDNIMEEQMQSEYTVVRRTAAVPVPQAEIPAPQESVPDKAEKAEKVQKPPKVRRKLSGEGKLLLMQTVAGLLMLLAVAVGAALGGGGFRTWYRTWAAWRSVDLPSLVEPIEPEPVPAPESSGISAQL